MLGIYLFAAIIGGGLLLLTILGGAEHNVDHPDASGFDSSHDIDHGIGHDTDAGHDTQAGASGLILGLFRPRNITFFLAAFGLTGTLLTLISPTSGSVIPSVAMGLGAMLTTHGVFVWLRRSESAVDVVSDAELEGCVGRVVLQLAPGERGRIACRIGDEELRLVARLADGYSEPLLPGREVVVLDVSNTVARVMPLESRELPPSDS